MVSKIIKISLIILGVLILAFVGLVIYKIINPSPEPPSEALSQTLPSEEATKPAPCFFTTEPEETWPDKTASDPPIGNVELIKYFQIKTYDVFGSNVDEVAVSKRENMPTVHGSGDDNGKRVSGITNTLFNFTGHLEKTAAGCSITRAKVTINITIILPEWVNKAAASDQDQKMWGLYLTFLKRHEQGHVNIALKAAREFQAELAQAKSAPSCQELNDKTKALFAATKQKRNEADDDYHKRTKNAKNQIPHEYNQTSVFPFTCDWRAIKI